MNEILNKNIVLVLNHNWQAVIVRTPQAACCMMATNVATALDIVVEPASELSDPPELARASCIRPVFGLMGSLFHNQKAKQSQPSPKKPA